MKKTRKVKELAVRKCINGNICKGFQYVKKIKSYEYNQNQEKNEGIVELGPVNSKGEDGHCQ